MRISYRVLILLLGLTGSMTGTAFAEVCSASWIGGAGNWTNAANWDITGEFCGGVPNNGSGITYDVVITFGAATVDSPGVVIDTLFIGGSGTVDIVSGGELGVAGRTGASCAGICNDGQLKISGGDLVLEGRVEYSGNGTVPVSATGVSRVVNGGITTNIRLTVLPGSGLNIVSQDVQRGFLRYEGRLTNAGTLNQQNVEVELTSAPVNSGTWTVDGTSVLDYSGGAWNNTDGTLSISDGALLQFTGLSSPQIVNGTLSVADGARVEVLTSLRLSGVNSSAATGTFDIQEDSGLAISNATAFRAAEVILRNGTSLDGDDTSAWEVSGGEVLKVSGNAILSANVLGTGLEMTRVNPVSTDPDQLTINASFRNGEFTIFGGLPVWLPTGGEIELTRLLITDGASLTVNGGRLSRETGFINQNREIPRLCRGDSRSLTF